MGSRSLPVEEYKQENGGVTLVGLLDASSKNQRSVDHRRCVSAKYAASFP